MGKDWRRRNKQGRMGNRWFNSQNKISLNWRSNLWNSILMDYVLNFHWLGSSWGRIHWWRVFISLFRSVMTLVCSLGRSWSVWSHLCFWMCSQDIRFWIHVLLLDQRLGRYWSFCLKMLEERIWLRIQDLLLQMMLTKIVQIFSPTKSKDSNQLQ